MKTNSLFKRIILSISGILIFHTSFCQENYLPGYIVSLNGDTLHGFIDYRNWDRNPDKIFFKDIAGNKKTSYLPLDIKKFSVLDEIYESAIVETEISTNNTEYLEHDNELKIKIDTAFLQTMIKGSKSLFYYKNKTGKKLFYIKPNSVYELLIHKRYFKEQDRKTVIAENKKYLGQLSLYLQDCPTIQSKLKFTEYDNETLEKLFQFYYNCTHSAINFQKKTEKYSFEFGLLAGLTNTTLKFKASDAFDNLKNVNFNQSVNGATGLFLDIILPRNNGKLSIYNEINYTSYNVNDYASTNGNNYATFAYSYLKMINMLRYKYPIGNLFIYFNAGMSYGCVTSGKNQLKNNTQSFEEHNALNEIKKYELGYVLGIGAKFKKCSFEFRREKADGISTYALLSSYTTRYYFLFGYRF